MYPLLLSSHSASETHGPQPWCCMMILIKNMMSHLSTGSVSGAPGLTTVVSSVPESPLSDLTVVVSTLQHPPALVIMVTVSLPSSTHMSTLLEELKTNFNLSIAIYFATAVLSSTTCHWKRIYDVIIDHDGDRSVSRSRILEIRDDTQTTLVC